MSRSETIPEWGRHVRPLDRVSVAEQAARQLSDMIFGGDVKPGDTITEETISKAFGISRVTAREVVANVVYSGTLRRAVNKTAYVPQLAAQEFEDIWSTRLLVEKEVIDALVRNPQKGMTQLLKTNVAELESWTLLSRSDIATNEMRFHQSLVDQTGSRAIGRVFRVLQGGIHHALLQADTTLNPQRIAAQHNELLIAIEHGQQTANSTSAISIMESHLIDIG